MPLFSQAPAPAPCGDGTFPWGPRYRPSCVSVHAPHPPVAKARRVYKWVGRKTTKLGAHSGSGRRCAVKSDFYLRRVRLPGLLSWSPVSGGPGGRRLKTPRRSRMFSPPSTPGGALVTLPLLAKSLAAAAAKPPHPPPEGGKSLTPLPEPLPQRQAPPQPAPPGRPQ